MKDKLIINTDQMADINTNAVSTVAAKEIEKFNKQSKEKDPNRKIDVEIVPPEQGNEPNEQE